MSDSNEQVAGAFNYVFHLPALFVAVTAGILTESWLVFFAVLFVPVLAGQFIMQKVGGFSGKLLALLLTSVLLFMIFIFATLI